MCAATLAYVTQALAERLLARLACLAAALGRPGRGEFGYADHVHGFALAHSLHGVFRRG